LSCLYTPDIHRPGSRQYKRLEFFEKDYIQPSDSVFFKDFYKGLITFKKSSAALQVPPYGGVLKEVPHTGPSSVFAFTRETAGNRVLALFNFSDQSVSFRLTGTQADGCIPTGKAKPVTTLHRNIPGKWDLTGTLFSL
jgi:glycosidase